MSTARGEAKSKCVYECLDWHCPFDAVEGKDKCIFHLPVDDPAKVGFWTQLNLYLSALYATTQNTMTQAFMKGHDTWFSFVPYDHPEMKAYQRAWHMKPWRFTGFEFPAMDERHALRNFVLLDCDFAEARFRGTADFDLALFEGVAKFDSAEFLDKTTFGGVAFLKDVSFQEVKFGDDLSMIGTAFHGKANFWKAHFRGRVEMADVLFKCDAYFNGAHFEHVAGLGKVTHDGGADYGGCRFDNLVLFEKSHFHAPVRFDEARFGQAARFSDAVFEQEVNFRETRFGDVAEFKGAKLSSSVDFFRAEVQSILDFTRVELRNRLLFEGTLFGSSARVLLWDVDFVRGTSDVAMEEGNQKGRIVEPAGQAVFRDILEGMNRVSFLHTDILTDRLLVRFSNVKWEKDPRNFVFDAVFTFNAPAEWRSTSGLRLEDIAWLPVLFHTEQELPKHESSQQAKDRIALETNNCWPLIRRDVERIAREIRQSYERYGNYSDAGDYYIAEMAYRERTTPWSKPFLKVGLCFYGLLSRYGESAGRALSSVLTGLLLFGYAFVIAGFKFMGTTVNRDLRFVWSERWATIGDIWLAVRMALANLMPGNLRGDVLGLELTSPATKTWAVLQVIVTYILLTLLLLAIRRRFRR